MLPIPPVDSSLSRIDVVIMSFGSAFGRPFYHLGGFFYWPNASAAALLHNLLTGRSHTSGINMPGCGSWWA